MGGGGEEFKNMMFRFGSSPMGKRFHLHHGPHTHSPTCTQHTQTLTRNPGKLSRLRPTRGQLGKETYSADIQKQRGRHGGRGGDREAPPTRRLPEEQLIKLNVKCCNRQCVFFIRQAERLKCCRCHYTDSCPHKATENNWWGIIKQI